MHKQFICAVFMQETQKYEQNRSFNNKLFWLLLFQGLPQRANLYCSTWILFLIPGLQTTASGPDTDKPPLLVHKLINNIFIILLKESKNNKTDSAHKKMTALINILLLVMIPDY